MTYDYVHVTQFDYYIFVFYIRCFFFFNSSHFSSIDVTPSILRRWRVLCAACGKVWSGFGGVSVRQVALWCVGGCVCGIVCVWCVCLCVCVCGVCVVCVCVCVCVGVCVCE